MKNLFVRKATSIYQLTKSKPIFKSSYIGNGKYEATKVGEEKIPLVERGMVGIEAFFTARKTRLVKQMWAIWRARRSRVGQLKLF